jgi:Uma2 family endonuclease
MSAATLTLPPAAGPVSEPQPHRWTVAEYRELAKTGMFHDKKTMLLDGVLFVTVMPNPPHDTALGLTEDWLRSVFTAGYQVRSQKGLDIGTGSDPGPDLAVVRGSIRDYATQAPQTAEPIVEVADSSLVIDTTTKAELYATAGVRNYWVLDLANRQLLVFRDPVPLPAGLGATVYRTHKTFGPSDSAAPLAASNSPVRVADLLP